MKSCPYRKTHEFDSDRLCKHCYAKDEAPIAQTDDSLQSTDYYKLWSTLGYWGAIGAGGTSL